MIEENSFTNPSARCRAVIIIYSSLTPSLKSPSKLSFPVGNNFVKMLVQILSEVIFFRFFWSKSYFSRLSCQIFLLPCLDLTTTDGNCDCELLLIFSLRWFLPRVSRPCLHQLEVWYAGSWLVDTRQWRPLVVSWWPTAQWAGVNIIANYPSASLWW